MEQLLYIQTINEPFETLLEVEQFQLGQGGMFPGANITVAEQIRRIKQEIDSGDYSVKGG